MASHSAAIVSLGWDGSSTAELTALDADTKCVRDAELFKINLHQSLFVPCARDRGMLTCMYMCPCMHMHMYIMC